jgi:hypothetical protein
VDDLGIGSAGEEVVRSAECLNFWGIQCRLEVKTNQTDLGTNPGVVHSVLLPATGGTWKTAIVPWAKFTLPDWVDVPDKTVAVKKAGITKFQWAIQDAPGTTGGLAVDNVKLPGMTAIPIGIRNASRAFHGLRMSQAAGRLDVTFDLAAGESAAKFTLVDLKGHQVSCHEPHRQGPASGVLGHPYPA